jgi:1,4-alpha-glucan branching enzyme
VELIDQDRQVLAIKRWNDAGNQVLLIANLRDEPSGEVVLENKGLADGAWREMINDAQVQVNGGRLVDSLEPSQAKVYVKQ